MTLTDAIRRALEFYADGGNYAARGWQGDQDPPPVLSDRGFLARKALTALEDLEREPPSKEEP